MSSMRRSASAPLRKRSRYSSVLESALVGLGREDAVVLSTRKKRRYDANHSPVQGLTKAFSAPERRPQTAAEDDEDPFASLTIIKSLKKKKKKRSAEQETRIAASPAVTRSASKRKRHQSRRHVDRVDHTPVTRSITRKNNIKSSLELIEDVEMEMAEDENIRIHKKLVFPSPKQKKHKMQKEINKGRTGTNMMIKGKKRERKSRKALGLHHWRVKWPLEVEAGSNKVKMEVLGVVDGKVLQFVVGKREGVAKFTSRDGTYVALSGKLDRHAAKKAGIPRAMMKLIEDGIPPFFGKRLLPFVSKAKELKKRKPVATRKRAKKRRDDTDKTSLLMPAIEEEADMNEQAITLPSNLSKKRYETPKAKKAHPSMQKKMKNVYSDNAEPESEADPWTQEQLQALGEAKLQIPTTASNFWAQVAQFVPGKSAQDCQAKTFEHFRSPPTNRKAAKKSSKRVDTGTKSAVPIKVARAGSNKFKKQVREFVEAYEKKHVDDVFNTTPSKENLPELPEFNAIKSPELGTPSPSMADEDSDNDEEAPGLLKKLSSRRRDDIDSYVLGINRQHVAGGGKMVCGKVRRVAAMGTPAKAAMAKATSTKKKAVMLVEDVGSQSMRAVVSPGGTTHVRIERNSSSSESEDCESSEGEENYDIL